MKEYTRQQINNTALRMRKQGEHEVAELVEQLFELVIEQNIEIADLDARLTMSEKENDKLYEELNTLKEKSHG